MLEITIFKNGAMYLYNKIEKYYFLRKDVDANTLKKQ